MTFTTMIVSVLAVTLFANPAFADADMEAIVDDFLISSSGIRAERCFELYKSSEDAARSDRNDHEPSQGKEVFSLVHEGVRLRCESLRLIGEATRLEGERVRLLNEAARLDAMWEKERHSLGFEVTDYPGRDKSQRKIRRDADAISGSILVLQQTSKALEDESRRILLLARASVDDLDDQETEVLMISLNAQSKNDIIKRLIGDDYRKT